jgi:hypothetical protein
MIPAVIFSICRSLQRPVVFLPVIFIIVWLMQYLAVRNVVSIVCAGRLGCNAMWTLVSVPVSGVKSQTLRFVEKQIRTERIGLRRFVRALQFWQVRGCCLLTLRCVYLTEKRSRAEAPVQSDSIRLPQLTPSVMDEHLFLPAINDNKLYFAISRSVRNWI